MPQRELIRGAVRLHTAAARHGARCQVGSEAALMLALR